MWFVTQDGPDGFLKEIEKRQFPVLKLSNPESQKPIEWKTDARHTSQAIVRLKNPIDWLVSDHYGLDQRWEQAVRSVLSRIMVIDDLANRPHDCDILLDQTHGEDGTRYKKLIPSHTHGLFGSQFCLLRPQFTVVREELYEIKNPFIEKIIHVFFGAGDSSNSTCKFSSLLLENFPEIQVRVVVGDRYKFPQDLERLHKSFPNRFSWDRNVEDMARHMAKCNLAVGAPGMATWERACLGLPAAYLAIQENQANILQNLDRNRFCVYLGLAGKVQPQEFIGAMSRFLKDEEKLKQMRNLSLTMVDGLGVQRVAAHLLGTPAPENRGKCNG